ncbi:1-(5-phosphoribosyl)-5-[(5-phosphoribosylamino)methylideneamino]imidazole-4-carboxamide isomerase [Clostridium gasigenes]|uniref:1-(5-phosphoribosyl)-5-[(5- phosphoribosylamino)methylideneamino]imidazole-4- carboxamide isomerase n=1 Tax=Clostridium gasigenes TaxID=94869 RepID=UPI0014383A23|nr:1-(5-phosphoribosyl)-5-[(5-phosphoribosylamino)methylideneamino]imidazole-4-carboxamide isomerase [Clostridium gasigenes]NKF06250.1 1-(5-phosphoribosyl)-5-[(5-phosphoribosylamino)methylideneamino]imidazole-4-carboxamide isomerase [Clostridium gasigenes]QSW20138.1 1-(5-phosphoribosyl)-5-[(5-phosphoribosylamino)methylideneamino]imidazole-4-carboxamide isomerase [Clostridium gasigenes]
MIIIPAIDIIDGKPVRLYQGNYNRKEIVAEDVLETALSFQKQGAEFIHLVDLDGAKKGKSVNGGLIIKVANALDIPVEVGGGIRTFETIEYLINNGISRVILGTIAMEDRELVKKAVENFGEKIAVGIDCKNGYAYGKGWLEGSEIYYIDFAKDLERLGVKNIIVTDISKDGTLEGPNVDMIKKLKKEVNIDITVSGGIANISDIKELMDISVYGAITGKAIYAKTLSLEESINLCKEE